MAVIIRKALTRLMPPKGFSGGASQVLDGLAVSLERAKEFLRAVEDESNPGTATAYIEEWLLLLGVSAPYGATLGDKRALALSAWTSLGGQSLDYINTQIRRVYPNAFIEEQPLDNELRMGEAEIGDLECATDTPTQLLYYVVAGYVNWARERFGLQGIIAHIIPAHLTQIFEARVQFDGDVARCGIATTGRSICGRATSLYSETAKETGLCAAGRCGTAITGRNA